ncbi:MAG TPA: hypothetical protein VGL86_26400 [Polyangia bacterium]
MLHDDQATLREFLTATGDGGVHIACAAGPESVAAAALLKTALARAGVRHLGTTVLGFGERIDSPAARGWFADAPALLLVGLRGRKARGAMPQLSIDEGDSDDESEPLAARAFTLGESIASLGDASWLAAVGLVERAAGHVLVERARWRHDHADLAEIAALLDAAARGPAPALESLNALEMLASSPSAHDFLDSVPAEVLRRTRTFVHAELARAARVRPRPGFGVVVVEYDSACHLEDLVALRWRGLRAGTVVLVANHGAVAGSVAVTARAAPRESFEARLGGLRAALADEGTTLLEPEAWTALRERLGVAPAPLERSGEPPFELSVLPN